MNGTKKERMRVLYISSDSEKLPCAGGGEHQIQPAGTGAEALSFLRSAAFDVVLAAFPLPGWSPDDLLDALRRVSASTPVIISETGGTFADAVRLTKLGAFHYLGDSRPEPPAMAALLQSAMEHRHSQELALLGSGVEEPWRKFLVGSSRSMENIAQIVRLVAPRKCTVLITGETGTGKEMVARAIHMAGGRAHLPLIAVNCNALPENLLEAELFGHVKGAFTGAFTSRMGRFEQAHRGTLFLDEIGDLPTDIQAKLLRVLQEREFQRLGSSETIRVDVRVIAATNADLGRRIREGKFREDLYYRLNVVPVSVPPLRDRLRDIPSLVNHFLEKICRQEDIPIKRITHETMDRLTRYSWPGNVRQLENAVEMAVALSGDRDTLFPADFPPGPDTGSRPEADSTVVALPDDGLDFEATVDRFQRQILAQALERTGGNKKQAAEILRLKRTTLTAKLRSLEALAAC